MTDTQHLRPYRVEPHWVQGDSVPPFIDGYEVNHHRQHGFPTLVAICADEATAQLLADTLNAQPVTP